MGIHQRLAAACASVLLAATLSTPTASAQSAAEKKITFTIAEQPLASALTDFARQARVQILQRDEEVSTAGKISPALNAESLSPQQALEKLLWNSGLKFEFINERTVRILPAHSLGQPETIGRSHDEAQSEVLAEIVVTGSNIFSTQEAHKRGTPVQVIGADDIDRTAAISLSDVLATNPAFTGGARGEQDSGGRGFVNLRGLGAQYTLVLLNGRRMSANDPLNAVSIPADAIERVEVLKSGASAVYGSDAVAGVVNVILRSRAEGLHASASLGVPTQSGGESTDANLFGGIESDTARFFFLLNHMTRDEVPARDRRITSSSDMRRYGGFDERSGTGNPARIGGIGSGLDLIADATRIAPGSFSLDPADYRPYDSETDLYDTNAAGNPSVITATERTTVIGNFEQDFLDGRMTFFAHGFYWQTRENNWRPPSTVSFSDASVGPIPASHPYNPFGQDVSDLDYRAVELGRQLMETQASTRRISGGLRAELGDWHAESAVSWYRSNYTVQFHNLFINSAMRASLNRSDANAFNPFCNQCNTPAQLAGLLGDNSLPIDFITDMADLRLSGPLFDLPTGTVQAAVGGEYRREEVVVGYDALTQSGGFAGWGSFVPYDLERTVRSLFAEVRVPLLPEKGGRGTSPLELSLAGRYEDYSDFGSTSTPLATLRYSTLSDQVILRASYAKSFLAPYLEYATPAYRSESSEVLIDPLTQTPIEAAVVVVGTPDIKPETGTTTNFGIILSPQAVPGLSVSLDFYLIEQNDFIPGSTNPQSVLNGTAQGTVTRGVGVGPAGEDLIVETPYYNLGQRKTSGYELALRYQLPSSGLGQFDLNLGLARLRSFEVENADGVLNDIAGGFDYTSGVYFSTGALPKTRGVLGVNWTRGAWSAASQYNFMSSFSDLSYDGESIDRTVPFYATFDFQVAYELFGGVGSQSRGPVDGARLTLGISNAFDRKLPFLTVLNGYNNAENDLIGRSIYARVAVDF